MTSQIDPTVPVAGNPTTASERANWATAKGEISALQTQTNGAPFLPLAGATMTGPMLLYNDPTGPMSPVTLGYFQTHGGGGGGSGGIPEAPADGTPYGRQDAGWHSVLGLPGGTLTGGLHFGSALASSVTDLTRHIDLYGGTYGFNVGPGSNLNYNAPSGFTHSLLIAGTAALQIGAAAITASAPITLPADPTLATQAATKRYIDNAITTQTVPDAPNDGHGYVRRNLAWGYGIPQLGASNDVTVVERNTGTIRMSAITGCLTPYNASSDGLSIQARRLSAPDGSGRNCDGPYITLAGPTYPGAPNNISLNTGSNAAGFFTWIFDAIGGLTTPGNVAVSTTAAAAISLYINAPAGQYRSLVFQSANSIRWVLRTNNTAESGSNAGSDFEIWRYNDAGTYIDYPLLITRNTGQVILGGSGTGAINDPLQITVGQTHYARIGFTVSNVRSWLMGCNTDGSFSLYDATAGNIARISVATGGAVVINSASYLAMGAACTRGIMYGTQMAYGSSNGVGFGWGTNASYPSSVMVSVDNGGASYPLASAASDERLKTDIVPSTLDCLATVRALPLHEYRWQAHDDPWDLTNPTPHPDLKRVGMIAQRVYEIFPEGVMKGDDHTDHMGLIWNIDQNNMIALLVGALQQLTTRVVTLENGSVH